MAHFLPFLSSSNSGFVELHRCSVEIVSDVTDLFYEKWVVCLYTSGFFLSFFLSLLTISLTGQACRSRVPILLITGGFKQRGLCSTSGCRSRNFDRDWEPGELVLGEQASPKRQEH